MDNNKQKLVSTLRVRVSYKDVHYGGNLIDGAYLIKLFGDAATELLIMVDGSEGLFLKYTEVEFLAPLYGGDFIEIYGEIYEMGKTSRKMRFTAHKVIAARTDIEASAADILDEPVLVCKAEGICVTPKSFQRK